MPLYAYRCTQCGHRFEKIQNFSAEPEKKCPKCHGVLERPPTAPSLNFKGAGWYVNDYAAKSSAPASESASEAGSESGKPAASSEAKAPSAASESTPSAPASTPAPSNPSGSTTPGSTS